MPNRVNSKIKPEYDFITRDDKPDRVGLVPKGRDHGAWLSKTSVLNYLLRLEADVKFWQELLNQIEEE